MSALARESIAPPLIGTVRVGTDVYDVRQDTGWPVTIWRDGQTVGYVTPSELRLACEGRVPAIGTSGPETARLAARHFRLRQAVAAIIRDPDQHIDLTGYSS